MSARHVSLVSGVARRSFLALALDLAGCADIAYTPAATGDLLRGQRGACRSLGHQVLADADLRARYGSNPGKLNRLRTGTTIEFSAQCGDRRADGILHCPLTPGAVKSGCRSGWQAEGVLDQGATFSADDGAVRLTDPEASNLVGIVIPAQFR